MNSNSIRDNLVMEEGAWCWFADNRALNYKSDDGKIDRTYIGCIDVHGAIKATQIDNKTNERTQILVRSNFQPDDHNNPTFLALPDGRIMIFYSRHTDEPCFFYRVSKTAGDITTFGEEKILKTDHNTTYPSGFIMSDDPEHFYLCWRGLNWHPTIGKLALPDENDEVKFVSEEGKQNPCQIVSSSIGGATSGIRPYAKYASNGKDRIYLTFTATHPDNICPNPIYCAYVDVNGMTLHDLKGNLLSTVSESPFKITGNETDSNYTLQDESSKKRGWVWEIVLDENKPVIAYTQISEDKLSHDYFYGKWNGENWTKTFITNGGGKFHKSDIEYCYSAGMALDKKDSSIVYASIPESGKYGTRYELSEFKMSCDGKKVESKTQLTFDSEKNNSRPFVLEEKNADKKSQSKLMWMNGDYEYWIVNSRFSEGFPTSIHSSFEIPQNKNLMARCVSEKCGEVSVSSEEITVLAKIRIDESEFKDGHDFKIMDIGEAVSLQIKDISSADSFKVANTEGAIKKTKVAGRLPVLSINGKEFKSTNMLSNSDWNKTRGNGTTDSTKDVSNVGVFWAAVTYSSKTGICQFYFNGLLDINCVAEKGLLSKENSACIKVEGFKGEVAEVKVYGGILTQSQIMEIAES